MEAFETLWRDLIPALLRYLSVSGESTEDVASDTGATVVKGLRRFTGDEAGWRGWVFITARRPLLTPDAAGPGRPSWSVA
ncbi:MAG: hypothetical protein ACYC1E_02200 [Propionibacteriaceae bacterium]